MATLTSSTLRLTKSNPFFSKSPLKFHAPFYSSFTIRATTEESSPSDTEEETAADASSDPDSFENRLSQVRRRYRSGTGKKAQTRSTRKGNKGSSGSGSGSSVFLPPIPLKEPVSEGLNVEFGFSPYSERVNGRIAMLGLSALLLVELATGKSVINYHTPAIVFIQVYFVAAVAAVYLKYEKEKLNQKNTRDEGDSVSRDANEAVCTSISMMLNLHNSPPAISHHEPVSLNWPSPAG
ncbi:hypothetical protein HAX54_010221 [Datura stramonium]|uniref:Uncharacterized protein n=1 Tax=Datura stramonium TaxID=4076 RepID=A0ABS8WXU7_DATST|nr:hypothetical protein [Datura stramonium]